VPNNNTGNGIINYYLKLLRQRQATTPIGRHHTNCCPCANSWCLAELMLCQLNYRHEKVYNSDDSTRCHKRRRLGLHHDIQTRDKDAARARSFTEHRNNSTVKGIKGSACQLSHTTSTRTTIIHVHQLVPVILDFQK